MPFVISLIAILVTALIVAICIIIIKYADIEIVPGYKRAGQRGEQIATRNLKTYLCEDDVLLTNCSIAYGERQAELDNVIVNKYGVFIVEVKNYSGLLFGQADDYEWRKYKITDAGNTYVKNVKNPIKQVKRQVYLLSQYLQSHGIDVWVKGYALLLEDNSPVQDEHVISGSDDVYNIFHTKDRNYLRDDEIEKISMILTEQNTI